jgi:hypothetical protein
MHRQPLTNSHFHSGTPVNVLRRRPANDLPGMSRLLDCCLLVKKSKVLD